MLNKQVVFEALLEFTKQTSWLELQVEMTAQNLPRSGRLQLPADAVQHANPQGAPPQSTSKTPAANSRVGFDLDIDCTFLDVFDIT